MNGFADIEEVADTFSGASSLTQHDPLGSRLSSLNLSFSSRSTLNPAFTFDTSSRSSSLRQTHVLHHSDSHVSRAGACTLDALTPPPHLPQQQLLLPAVLLCAPVVSAPLCAAARRHVTCVRRASTSAPQMQLDPLATQASLEPAPAATAGVTTTTTTTCSGSVCADGGTCYGAASTRRHSIGSAVAPGGACEESARRKRASPEPDSGMEEHGDAASGSLRSEALERTAQGLQDAPAAPTFAAFAAALAERYYAEYGSVPDVPNHLDAIRLKRQRVQPLQQVADV